MAKRRKPRTEPERDYDPLDEYSTWDVRIAQAFYYAVIIATIIIVFGIWGTIIDLLLVNTRFLDFYLNLPLGFQVALIGGIVTGHLLLLVLFYALFRGGIVRTCSILFKDRLIAKKWEDYTVLRWLIAVTLLGVYVTVISVVVTILPLSTWAQNLTQWMIENFGIVHWILYAGLMTLLGIGLVFMAFVIFNHWVYWVLRRIKTIEEEEEIREEIVIERLRTADVKTRRKAYRKETGKRATYRGKETKGYIEWKKKKGIL
ncbi:MAG: hypothetical protein ACTSYC_08765 [Promethearchaeota archaeon]